MEAVMMGEDYVVAELLALRTAIKKLIKVANIESAEAGEFGKNALKEGLRELIDINQLDVADERKPRLRQEAQERYRSLFEERE
jgi:hypothetical protein